MGDTIATSMAAIPTEMPHSRVPSAPPTTTFLKKAEYTASSTTEA